MLAQGRALKWFVVSKTSFLTSIKIFDMGIVGILENLHHVNLKHGV